MIVSKFKNVLPLALLGVSLIVLAAIRGPFHVSAAGPEWAQTTYATDSNNEYEAAEQLFKLYVQSTIVSPADRLRSVKHDFLRVVYWDGQIADFKINNFNNSLNLKFRKLQPTVDAKADPGRVVEKINKKSCTGKGAQYMVNHITYDTGYWGDVQGTRPNPDGGLPIVYIVSDWISTGSVTVTETETCK